MVGRILARIISPRLRIDSDRGGRIFAMMVFMKRLCKEIAVIILMIQTEHLNVLTSARHSVVPHKSRSFFHSILLYFPKLHTAREKKTGMALVNSQHVLRIASN